MQQGRWRPVVQPTSACVAPEVRERIGLPHRVHLCGTALSEAAPVFAAFASALQLKTIPAQSFPPPGSHIVSSRATISSPARFGVRCSFVSSARERCLAAQLPSTCGIHMRQPSPGTSSSCSSDETPHSSANPQHRRDGGRSCYESYVCPVPAAVVAPGNDRTVLSRILEHRVGEARCACRLTPSPM